MRLAVAVVLLAGCSEPPLPTRPLPPLQQRQEARVIDGGAVLLAPGEAMSWAIKWRGLDIGTADLAVVGLARSTRVQSRFVPGGFAAQLRPQHHELTTTLDHPTPPDDLHSAIGRVRGWAREGATPARLDVLHGGERYDVKLATPEIERPLDAPAMLRVEGRARSPSRDIELTVWLSTDGDRVPLSATVDVDGQTVTAELVDYSRGR